MKLPDFIPDIDGKVRARIDATLGRIEADHDVRILFAIESGSRAWGFPSPDSDYDVRFVHAHWRDWYLSLKPGRDVIELPIADDLDINGWDIRKALNLLLKTNPVLLEWLSSPVRYRWSEQPCAALTAFGNRMAFRSACRWHYLHLGETQFRRYLEGREIADYKRYFYVLRPALALRWLRLNPDRPAPMNLQALVAGLDLDGAAVAQIGELLELKARSSETGEGPRFSDIDALIESELRLAADADYSGNRHSHEREADALFRDIVEERLT